MLPTIFVVNCTTSLEFNLRGFVLLFYSNKLYHISEDFSELNTVCLFYILHVRKIICIIFCVFSVELGCYRNCTL